MNGKEHWVREKHGICKARLQTLNDNIIKPENPSEIQSQHSHGPDIARVEMLKGYNVLKIAARNSERWDHFPFVYGLLKSKNELTYDRMFNKLLELEPEMNPSSIMIDFEKAAMNSLEKKFIACVSGCFFHLSQSIYRKIKANGLTTDYQQDRDFALKLKMLPYLAFVPEIDVIDSFNILMEEYPHSALNAMYGTLYQLKNGRPPPQI